MNASSSAAFSVAGTSSAKDGLFEVKETYNQKTDWRGTQTLITPKGRETFRLLMIGGAHQ